MKLPDAESLLTQLAERMRADVGPDTRLVGIHTGGVWIAQRLQEMLGIAEPVGTIDISFYRDDYRQKGLSAAVRPSDLPFDVEKAQIVLVDDVLFTGRTIRAAMNEIFDYGRPAAIRLAALVDRGGRELPICAQYLGERVEVAPDEVIELQRGADGRLSFLLTRRSD